VSVPTVSADPGHQADIQAGAKLAANLLEHAGLQVELVATTGHPVIFGRHVHDQSYPTITIYNHLDVQPARPADWKTDPFTLTKAGDRYIGRGATDDKGPALTALLAVEYAIKHEVPLNFIVLWELEEEIGSPHFEEFVKSRLPQLATDSVVVSDTVWVSAGHPAIPYALRGLITFELSLRTSEEEAHSGEVGGAARNPVGELAQIIAECYDAVSGNVKIPGFYDDVQAASPDELDEFARSGFSVQQFVTDHKLLSLRTHNPKEVLSRIMTEPTFEVHGIEGGYTGPGVKTVVPPHARAKLSARLVPHQDPQKIFQLIKTFITARHPDVTVTLEAAAKPYLGDTKGAHARAAVAAMVAGFGAEPTFNREGGTIGAVLTMQQYLKAPIVMLGLSLPEHGYHAPNEYYDWRQTAGGIKMFVSYFNQVAAIKS
jgi:acetylornithine deacetylase/succinyl-diaminopimelate desuccinylase-like protein